MVGDGVVLFDIDGGLADMSGFDAVLRDPEVPRRAAWKQFFSHFHEAPVVESGLELVTASVNLGFTAVYSTTRPWFSRDVTKRWLLDQGFPDGPVLARSGEASMVPAAAVKVRHCQMIRKRVHNSYVAAFIDDESDVVEALRDAGFAGRRFERLVDCSPSDLCNALVFGPRGLRERPWSRRMRGPITAAAWASAEPTPMLMS